MNTARVQAHIDKLLKEQGEQILKELGVSTAELIRMTFRQLVKKKASLLRIFLMLKRYNHLKKPAILHG